MQRYDFNTFVNRDFELHKILKYLPPIRQEGPWLAGGSIWKSIENTPLDSDLDFFFKNSTQYDEWMRIIKSIPYVHHIVEEKKNKYNTTLIFHICDGIFNKTIKVQGIYFKFWDTLEKVLEDFDFTACQFGYDGNHLYTGDTSFEDLKKRIIVFNKITDPKATLYHIKKYTDRGFVVSLDKIKELEKSAGICHPATPIPFDNNITVVEDSYPDPPVIDFGFNNLTVVGGNTITGERIDF